MAMQNADSVSLNSPYNFGGRLDGTGTRSWPNSSHDGARADTFKCNDIRLAIRAHRKELRDKGK
jgi:hypothetical protein